MHLWYLGKLILQKQISSEGEIINDIDNTVYEAKTLTSQHKHDPIKISYLKKTRRCGNI